VRVAYKQNAFLRRRSKNLAYFRVMPRSFDHILFFDFDFLVTPGFSIQGCLRYGIECGQA